ncbi:hypothetical protein GGX14DRAFT_626671 [Mycena pura]|uniref:Uncharacterized protein n=1 Tax=Mycena pura TaxID=153505 RepID=A0AAD6YQI7_9AGAR|nr:hypothetical protein GGX14DRAFT_626671 [Mycena pura]
MNLARTSFRILSGPPTRRLHRAPISLQKKKAAAVTNDVFDDEDQWGTVEDLFPSAPVAKSSPSLTSRHVVASTAVPSSHAPAPLEKAKDRRLSPGHRRHKFTALVRFVEPRIGRNPTKRTPLVRRTVFPQLIQLASMPEHLRTISELMVTWKEGRLGTQGKARFGPDGQPKGAHPFDEPTSELFARRCDELGVPEHALAVFGAFRTHALPLTLPAARRLLRSLSAAGRPFADVVTAAALFDVHQLPPPHEDLPSCALLLGACLRHLETAEGAQRKETQALAAELIKALEKRLADAAPMPGSRDVLDKTIRQWLKSVMREVNKFLQQQEQPRGWLETWMIRSRFLPSSS